MSEPYFVDIVLGLVSLGLTVTIALLGIIFSWLKVRIDKNEDKLDMKINELRKEFQDRLRTQQHEDREIRAQVNGVYTLLTEQLQEVKRKKK